MEAAPLRDIKCPHCGHEFEMRLYDVMDGYLYPNVKTMLLAQMVVDNVCPNCKNNIVNNMIYHNMKKDFCIIFSLESSFYEKVLNVLHGNTEEDFGLKRYTDYENVRVVTNYNDMLEKLMIFESGMNDIYVEILKQRKTDISTAEAEFWVFMSRRDKDNKETYFFYPVVNGYIDDHPVSFEMEEYYQIVREYQSKVEKIGKFYEDTGDLAERLVKGISYDDLLRPMTREKAYLFSRSIIAKTLYTFFDPESEFHDEDQLFISSEDVEVIEQNWLDMLEELERDWYLNHETKPTVNDLGGPLLEQLIYLMNSYLTNFDKRNPESREMMMWLLDKCDFTGKRTLRHEIKRLLLNTLNDEVKETYINKWVEEEPNCAYVIGQLILCYFNSSEFEKARETADKYLHMEIRYKDDYWLYNACQAVYMFFNLQDKVEEVKWLRSEVDDEALI